MSKTTQIHFNEHAVALKQISEKCNIPRDVILDEAVGLRVWALCEKTDGRRICSVEAATIEDDCVITEFVKESDAYMYESPLLSKAGGHKYRIPYNGTAW
jgi:hypothetical protein